MTSATVRGASAVRDMNHREPQFLQSLSEARNKLIDVYPGATEFVPCLIGGSGTAAVEAMLTSLCAGEGEVLVLANGYYSGRVASILEVHRIPHRTIEFGWLEPIDLARVEAELTTGQIQAVVATHHETTSGRLNPIEPIARLCRQHGALCLVDAISSFGADPLDLTDVDAVCGSANKCLHGLPGVSFVLVRRSLEARMSGTPRRTFYLHLPMYLGERPPLTPPVPAMAALLQALREMPPGGASARQADYTRRARIIRDGLAKRGFKWAIPEKEFSCSLTVATLPVGWTWDRWSEANLERGYMLYECKGPLRERYFQVANMGALTDEQLEGWLLAVDAIFAG